METLLKRITHFIGQAMAIAKLNEIIDAFNYATKKGEHYQFDPIFLLGPTGTGKTTIAAVMAEHMQRQFHVIPPNSGFREWANLAAKLSSFSEDGSWSAIPATILIDEVHSQKTLFTLIKKISETEGRLVIERNGVKFAFDPREHLLILATDTEMERSQKRRCVNVTLGTVTQSEAQQIFVAILARLSPSKTIHKDALVYLSERTKPYPGDIKQVCMSLKNQTTDKITLDVAKHVMRVNGLTKNGLDIEDRITMSRIAGLNPKGQPIADAGRGASLDTLQNIPEIMDVKSGTTRKRLGYLQALGLAEKSGRGYVATKACVTYLRELSEALKNAKAKAAGKSATGKGEPKKEAKAAK